MKTQKKRKPVYFYFIPGDITDKRKLRKHRIDAVVNAARPTLMGSEEAGVDRSIHQAVDRQLRHTSHTFNDRIRKEIDGKERKPEASIRCRRGKAVITKGYGLCSYVIHAVGTMYAEPKKDGTRRRRSCCPSSSVQGLESCYHEIVEILKQHPDIRRIAVPVIGSGNYGYPMEYALSIAVASLYNAVLDWYQKDPEMFSMENNGEDSSEPYIRIYFYIKDVSAVLPKEKKKILKTIWKFRICMEKEKRISYQSSFLTQLQYLSEVWKNDGRRGYFAIAKTFRLFLILLRIILSPLLVFKDVLGGNSWQGRRCIVELMSCGKAASGMVFYLASLHAEGEYFRYFLMAVAFVSIVFLVDTVSYLLALIVLADIQRPSANIIRSLILLLVNYIEVQMDLAFICYAFYRIENCGLAFREALKFTFFGEALSQSGRAAEILSYCREGLSFLFITFAFGYFLNHVRMRKFSDG